MSHKIDAKDVTFILGSDPGRLTPKHAWAAVYCRRMFPGDKGHETRREQSDRAKRLVLFWIRGVTS